MFDWRNLRPWPSKTDADLDKEIRAHLDLEAEELQESGADSEEARYGAQRAFGNST